MVFGEPEQQPYETSIRISLMNPNSRMMLANERGHVMNPLEWLQETVPGFNELSDEERAAIRDFALLWSLFEGSVLGARASAGRIVEVMNGLHNAGRLDLVPLEGAIGHFRQRYFDGQNFTQAFEHLHLRNGDNRPLVEAFVSGRANDNAEILSGLLIIVYRLRNNLFHGIKWAYGIRDQLQNFRHANDSLMAAMDMARAAGMAEH